MFRTRRELVARDVLFASVIVAASVAAVFVRLYYGVIVDDEAFYLAIPYRFVLGDRPFVDEVNVRQLSGMLTYPLVKSWHWLQGGTDGLVLFMRRCYLLFSLLVACSVFYAMREKLGTAAALLLGLIPILFVPFNIPSLSYNTLGMGLLTLGLFLSFQATTSRNRTRLYGAAGLAHGLACVAYPTLFVVPLFQLAVIAAQAEQPRFSSIVRYATAVAVIGAACGMVMLLIGVEHIIEAFDYTSSQRKYYGMLQGSSSELQYKAFLAVWLLLALGTITFARKLSILFVGLLPLLLYLSLATQFDAKTSVFYIIYLALVAPPFTFKLGDSNWARRLLGAVWLPAFVAAIAFSATSATGFRNSALGLMPGAIVAAAFLALALRHGLTPGLARWAMLLPLVVINAVLVFALYAGVYRDPPIPRLDTRITTGPYSGLYTTGSRQRRLEELTRELRMWEHPEARILVYYGFSAGYLLTSMPPASNSIWLVKRPVHQEVYIKGYERNLHPRNVVLRLGHQSPSDADPLDQLVVSQHRLVKRTWSYRIYAGQAE